jgi:DNA-binding response OmpR family regulator
MFALELGTEGIQVLLVEDSRREALLAQRLLHHVDDEFDIHRVATMKEPQQWLDTKKVDVVVLDLGLPDSDGPHSIRTLRQQCPDLPIVVLSGQNNAMAAVRSLENGAQEFLLKEECSGKMIRQAILNAIFRKSKNL